MRVTKSSGGTVIVVVRSLTHWELSSRPAVAAVTSPAMTVLTQQIISPRLSLINNNNNHIQVELGPAGWSSVVNTFLLFFQSGTTKLKRSWSTGSGDKIQSKTLPDSSDITDKLIEAIPDLLTSLVINSHQTQLFGNNNLSEEKMMETLDLQLDIKDNFEPGQLGLMEDPGVISFDSLDYPEDLSDFDDDEVEMEEKVHDFSKRMLRFSFDDLISSRQFSKQEQKLRMRTKSLSDINEILVTRQHSHREKTKKIS